MIEDGQLVIDWMQSLLAPQVVTELIVCKCSRIRKAPECQCVLIALKCSPVCKNQFCDSTPEDDYEESGDDSSDEDDSDSGEDST